MEKKQELKEKIIDILQAEYHLHILPLEVEALIDTLDGRTINSRWSIEDIDYALEYGGHKASLSEDDKKNILAIVKKHHDAEYGINWDLITYHTEDYCEANGIEIEEAEEEQD
jgi:hypothetical protein